MAEEYFQRGAWLLTLTSTNSSGTGVKGLGLLLIWESSGQPAQRTGQYCVLIAEEWYMLWRHNTGISYHISLYDDVVICSIILCFIFPFKLLLRLSFYPGCCKIYSYYEWFMLRIFLTAAWWPQATCYHVVKLVELVQKLRVLRLPMMLGIRHHTLFWFFFI